MKTNEIVFKLEEKVLFSPSERCLNGPDGTVAILTENNLRFLLLLLNGVTEKEEIIKQVWKEQRGAISESSYYGQLYMLRKAFLQVGLKDSLIRTIPRKGVQYAGNVSRIEWNEPCEKISVQEQIKAKNNIQQDTSFAAQKPILSSKLTKKSLIQAKVNYFKDSRWQPLISILAIFGFFWLSFLLVLIIIILLKK